MKNKLGLENFSEALVKATGLEDINIEDIDIFELFDSDILDIIPGLKLLKNTYKGVMNIRDKLFTKKFILFIKQFNELKIDNLKLSKFKEKFEKDKSYRTKVMESLILHIDEYKQYEKVKILSRLFAAYLNEHFDWNHLLNMADCLERVAVNNIQTVQLHDTTEGKEVTIFNESEQSAESNLISAGLAIKMSTWSSDTYPTQIGKDIYKYGLK